jgi:hydroxyacylglutathione hydrolase
MLRVHRFTFNPYAENTYVLFDASGKCIIIDPGCYTKEEKNELKTWITDQKLEPVLLLNTHCHIDHILGNAFVYETYGLVPRFHRLELEILRAASVYGPNMGFRVEEAPEPEVFLDEKDSIHFGESELNVLFTPGHSPGSLIFYHTGQKIAIGGDVLFFQSIGRTDLPGGNHMQLISSIRDKLFMLENDYIVYPGHGPETTIGYEKLHNPYIT